MKKNQIIYMNLILILVLFLSHVSTLIQFSGVDLKIEITYPRYVMYWGKDSLGNYMAGQSGFDWTLLIFALALVANSIALLRKEKET